jgi:hypothetical protein
VDPGHAIHDGLVTHAGRSAPRVGAELPAGLGARRSSAWTRSKWTQRQVMTGPCAVRCSAARIAVPVAVRGLGGFPVRASARIE